MTAANLRENDKHGETQEYPRLEVTPSQVFFCRSEEASDRVKNSDVCTIDPPYMLLYDAFQGALSDGSYELAASANSKGTSIKLGGFFAKHMTDAGDTVQIKALKVAGASGKTFTVAVEDIDVINGAYKQWVEHVRNANALDALPHDLESAWYVQTQRSWGGIEQAQKKVKAAEAAIPNAEQEIERKRDRIAQLEREITALVDSLPQLHENVLDARAELAVEESKAEEYLDELVQFFLDYPEHAERFEWCDEVVIAVYERLAGAGEPVPQWMLNRVEQD